MRVMKSLPLLALLWISAAWAQVAPLDENFVGYKDGFYLESADGKNTLHLQGRVQARFTYNGREGAGDTSTFAIQRGKITFDGNVLEKNLLYKFQMNMATRSANAGLATLEDFYFDWIANEFLGVRFGQFKVPFLMQELVSSGKQEFVDRSLATGTFNLSRDLGLAIHGELFNYHLGYSLFAMNGDGANNFDSNQAMLTGVRFEVPILGVPKYSEADVDYSEEQSLGLGAAYVFNEALAAIQGSIAARTKVSHMTGDLTYKYKGLFLTTAGMATTTHEGTKITNYGYYVQGGYFIIPRNLEVALKESSSFFQTLPNQYEHSIALNYFFKKHTVKLQTDYAFLKNNRGQGLNDNRIRTQMQVVF